jgi:hypothetical protein
MVRRSGGRGSARLKGTLLLVAIANRSRSMNLSRDLPDGRDLNRFSGPRIGIDGVAHRGVAFRQG